MNSPSDRREARLPIESIILPFFGSRSSDYQPFEYILQDVSPGGVKILIPDWVAGRERINKGERISLHVPFELGGKVLYSGSVAWQAPDEDGQGQVLGVTMDQGRPLSYPVFFSTDSRQLAIDFRNFSTKGQLLTKLAKDALLLKKGCLIYFKHLSAFFSRLSDLTREEYEAFRNFVFEDIITKTQKNVEYFTNFYGNIAASDDTFEAVLSNVDIAELRQAVEPEMYIELFASIYSRTFAMQYLYAIKELENKMFLAYNTLVVVYCSIL